MIGKVTYRGVVFGVFAMGSTHNGNTVVRPIATTPQIAFALRDRDVTKTCVGRANKVELDSNDDVFGVKMATYRSYRMLIGELKSEAQKMIATLDSWQADCRKEQDKLHDKRYPKTADVPAQAGK